MKICSKCNESKVLTEFYKKSNKAGKTSQCRTCIKANVSSYYKENSKEINEKRRNKELTADQLDARRVYRNKYMSFYRKKPEYAEYLVNYRKVYNPQYERSKLDSDSLFKFKYRIRRLVKISITTKGYSKKSNTYEILGADFETVKAHLEATWERNYGVRYEGQEVHIDHIIPMSSAKTEEEAIKLNHYSNLQYLTPEDNMRKGSKYER